MRSIVRCCVACHDHRAGAACINRHMRAFSAFLSLAHVLPLSFHWCSISAHISSRCLRTPACSVVSSLTCLASAIGAWEGWYLRISSGSRATKDGSLPLAPLLPKLEWTTPVIDRTSSMRCSSCHRVWWAYRDNSPRGSATTRAMSASTWCDGSSSAGVRPGIPAAMSRAASVSGASGGWGG